MRLLQATESRTEFQTKQRQKNVKECSTKHSEMVKSRLQIKSQYSPLFSESTSAFSINISRNLLYKFQTITYGNVRNNFRLLVFKEMCPNCVWTQNQRGVFNVKTFHAKCKYEKLNTFQQICSLNSCTLHVLFRTHTHKPREKKKKQIFNWNEDVGEQRRNGGWSCDIPLITI